MKPKLPLSVLVVGWFFVIVGVLCAGHLVVEIMHRDHTLDIGFPFIFLGWGLLRLHPAAHTWTMVVVVLGWILLALVVIASGIFDAGVVHVGPNHRLVTGLEKKLVVFGFAFVCGVLLAWVMRVLFRHGHLFKKYEAA